MTPLHEQRLKLIIHLRMVFIIRALRNLVIGTLGPSEPGTKKFNYGVLYGEVCRKRNNEGYVVYITTDVTPFPHFVHVVFNKDFVIIKPLRFQGLPSKWVAMMEEDLPLI